MPLLVVTLAVALQIGAALVLKSLADLGRAPGVLLLLGIAGVALLNGLRFLVWGVAHRRWPLSHSYPLASTFFPLMLAVAWAYGDPIRPTQVAGTALITAGVLWLTLRGGAAREG